MIKGDLYKGLFNLRTNPEVKIIVQFPVQDGKIVGDETHQIQLTAEVEDGVIPIGTAYVLCDGAESQEVIDKLLIPWANTPVVDWQLSKFTNTIS